MGERMDENRRDVAEERIGWDAFAGPVRLMAGDGAVPPHLVPMMVAAHGMRLAAEMNLRVLEGIARGR